MDYKVEGSLKKRKIKIIIGLILWLITVIVFVVPFSFSFSVATNTGKFDIGIFIEQFIVSIKHPFMAFIKVFTQGGIHNFITSFLIYDIVYVIAFYQGLKKDMPKNEYTKIEHGSSDWSQKGEQYKILSKEKGIILAENNYLPVDKRGNVNVLVVGRIRFW